MAKRPTDFASLAPEYNELWKTMVVNNKFPAETERQANKIIANKSRYMAVSLETTVPWYVIGLLHFLESGGTFTTHLHNGDSLKKRTVQKPAGRPVKGEPPFTWHVSAVDALKYDKLDKITDWSLARIAWACEKYNGMGYQMYHPNVKSPYLWSGSNHYVIGKYTSDGNWDGGEVSEQVGSMVLLKALLSKDPSIKLNEVVTPGDPPPVQTTTPPDVNNAQKDAKEIIKGSKTLSWLQRVQALILATIASIWATVKDWVNFDAAIKAKQFLTDHQGWFLLGAGFGLVMLFQYLKDDSVQTFKEGKWGQNPAPSKDAGASTNPLSPTSPTGDAGSGGE